MFPPRVTYLGAHHVGEPLPPSHLYDEEMGATTSDPGESWPHESSPRTRAVGTAGRDERDQLDRPHHQPTS